MKNKKMWISCLIIFLVLIGLSFSKFEIRNDIEINANKEEVWNAIVDFNNYNKWNTQLVFLGGEISANGNLHLRLAAKGMEPYEFKPTISHWEENKKFAWLAITGIPRVFDGEHFFEINELDNGRTLVVNREEYRGVFSLVMKHLPMMKDAPKGFEQMNMELKNYIENNSSR